MSKIQLAFDNAKIQWHLSGDDDGDEKLLSCGCAIYVDAYDGADVDIALCQVHADAPLLAARVEWLKDLLDQTIYYLWQDPELLKEVKQALEDGDGDEIPE